MSGMRGRVIFKSCFVPLIRCMMLLTDLVHAFHLIKPSGGFRSPVATPMLVTLPFAVNASSHPFVPMYLESGR